MKINKTEENALKDRVELQSTPMLEAVCRKCVKDYSKPAGILLEIAISELHQRLLSAVFIAFCREIEG